MTAFNLKGTRPLVFRLDKPKICFQLFAAAPLINQDTLAGLILNSSSAPHKHCCRPPQLTVTEYDVLFADFNPCQASATFFFRSDLECSKLNLADFFRNGLP